MPHIVRSKNTNQSSFSSIASLQDSYNPLPSGYLSPTSLHNGPSIQDHAQTDLSISNEDFEISTITLITARSSINTYADSEEDSEDSEYSDETDKNSDNKTSHPLLPEISPRILTTGLRVSNSTNFADYFPSSNTLSICHDFLSSDGRMNLRVDTIDLHHKGVIQLFHLRIQDLKQRQFSLRRYERASGCEVCKTSLKYVSVVPPLQRSVSAALGYIKLPSTPISLLQKLPSAHLSLLQKFRSDEKPHKSHTRSNALSAHYSNGKLVATNIILLEFSNYAHVEIKCRGGSRLGRRFEFEYWGHEYVWRHEVKYKGDNFNLYRTGHSSAIAHIVQESQNEWQRRNERRSGNFIPPYNMWISKMPVEVEGSDVADVIIATGLVALIDANNER